MEAVECSHAENWAGASHRAQYAHLPTAERLPSQADCAVSGAAIPDEALDWSEAERIGGGRLWVPSAVIGLDFTEDTPAWLDVSSVGLACGFDLDFASNKALGEVVERDAYCAWLRQPVANRNRDEIDIESIDFKWLSSIRERLNTLEIGLRIFAIPAVIPMPVIIAQLTDHSEAAAHQPIVWGISAHLDAESALRGAIVEAAQSRLTGISGARDDLALDRSPRAPPSFGLALPNFWNAPLQHFEARFQARHADSPAEAFAAMVEQLMSAGYPVVGRLLLSPADCAAVTVRVFVPGLGSMRRPRRVPIP